MATKAKKEDNAVALKSNGDISPFAASELPAHLQNQQGPARGNEEVSSKDMVLPRLELVQASSPIKEQPGNEDVRDGQLFNSVTGEVYGDFAYFVPVYYRMEHLIWKDSDSGGGFFGSFPSEDTARVHFNRLVKDDPSLGGKAENGRDMLEIVDTPVQFGLLIDPEGRQEQIVISMPKTKAKVSRKWNATIQLAGGDRFARVYKISSFTDENKKGKKFKNFVVQPSGFAPEAVYRNAEQLYEAFRSGAARAGHESVINGDDEAQGENGADGIDRGGI